MTDIWRPKRIAIIGIGLLGGSVGLAARRAWPDVTVIGYARRQETLDAAVKAGAATLTTDRLEHAVKDVDLICVGTPVTLIAEQVLQVAELCDEETIITDVGSTKASIVARIEKHPHASRKFVGSHPIAGGEKTGPQFAKADLFDNRLVVVTPTEITDPSRLAKIESFWQSLGARVARTLPSQHDEILAATSHLPHLVAAALASIIPDEAIDFAGPGWKDTTRVAGGCPEMWSAICEENQSALVHQLTRMIDCLEAFRSAVTNNDHQSMKQMLTKARENRDKVYNLQHPNPATN